MRPISLVLPLLLGALAANAHEGSHGSQATAPGGAQIDAERLLVREIEVVDDQSRSFPLVERMAGRGTVLLSFTYTSCETLCPLTNAILSGVEDGAAEQSLPLTIISMTIDPARDTPAAMAETRAEVSAGEDWLFLTAEPAPHRQLMADLAVNVSALEDHDPMFLLGDFCTGNFLRIVGIPEPDKLLKLAAQHQPCTS